MPTNGFGYMLRYLLLICVCSTLTIYQTAIGQSKIGLSFRPGMGAIYSPTLNKIQNNQTNSNPLITSSSAAPGYGFNMGLGIFYQYTINPSLAFLVDPSFNILFSKIYMNTKQENLDKNGSGTQIRTSSTANITSMYVHVPLMLKYTFFQKRKFYILAGGALNVMLQPKVVSEEYTTTSIYGFERISSATVSPTAMASATIDNYNPIQFAAVAGLGRQFRKGLRKFSLDLSYSHPLVGGNFYTSSTDLKDTKHNVLLSESGKMESESKTPQFRLNDFKLGVFNLTVRYTLKHGEKKLKPKKVDSTTVTTKEEVPLLKQPNKAAPAQETKPDKKAKKKKEKEAQVEDNRKTTGSDPQLATPAPAETKAEKKARKKKEKEEEEEDDDDDEVEVIEEKTPKKDKKPKVDREEKASPAFIEGAPKAESKKEKKTRLKKEAEEAKMGKEIK